MPVFARSKLVMEEYCLTLRPRLDFTYTGPNPQKAYQKLMDILITNIAVPRENIQEKDFRWDRGGEVENFSAALEVIKDYDAFSYMQMTISVKGTLKPSKEFGKEGNVSITIEGIVRTEYPQDTPWERSFIYEIFRRFYDVVLYKEQRKRFTDLCRDQMLTVQNELKSFFNLLPKIGA
jgi:hypothetical protein